MEESESGTQTFSDDRCDDGSLSQSVGRDPLRDGHESAEEAPVWGEASSEDLESAPYLAVDSAGDYLGVICLVCICEGMWHTPVDGPCEFCDCLEAAPAPLEPEEVSEPPANSTEHNKQHKKPARFVGFISRQCLGPCGRIKNNREFSSLNGIVAADGWCNSCTETLTFERLTVSEDVRELESEEDSYASELEEQRQRDISNTLRELTE